MKKVTRIMFLILGICLISLGYTNTYMQDLQRQEYISDNCNNEFVNYEDCARVFFRHYEYESDYSIIPDIIMVFSGLMLIFSSMVVYEDKNADPDPQNDGW